MFENLVKDYLTRTEWLKDYYKNKIYAELCALLEHIENAKGIQDLCHFIACFMSRMLFISEQSRGLLHGHLVTPYLQQAHGNYICDLVSLANDRKEVVDFPLSLSRYGKARLTDNRIFNNGNNGQIFNNYGTLRNINITMPSVKPRPTNKDVFAARRKGSDGFAAQLRMESEGSSDSEDDGQDGENEEDEGDENDRARDYEDQLSGQQQKKKRKTNEGAESFAKKSYSDSSDSEYELVDGNKEE